MNYRVSPDTCSRNMEIINASDTALSQRGLLSRGWTLLRSLRVRSRKHNRTECQSAFPCTSIPGYRCCVVAQLCHEQLTSVIPLLEPAQQLPARGRVFKVSPCVSRDRDTTEGMGTRRFESEIKGRFNYAARCKD